MDHLDKRKEELPGDLEKSKLEYESLQTLLQAEINRREYVENKMRLIEERFGIITHATLDIIFIIDKTGKCIFLNDRIEAVLGYRNEDIVGTPFTRLLPIKEIPRCLIQLKYLVKHKNVTEFQTRVIHKDGHFIDVEINGSMTMYQGELVCQGTVRDISERKRAQNDLIESLKSYKGLFDSVSEAIYIHNENGVFIDVNIGAAIMYGYTRNEMIGKSLEMISAPGKNDLQEVTERIKRTMHTGKPEQMEFWGMRKNEEIFPKEIIFHKGKYFGEDVIITTARDITEHKKTEQKLSLYKEIIDHSTDGIAILDKNGLYVEQNEAYKSLLGITTNELVGKTPAIHVGDKAFLEIVSNLETNGKFTDEVVAHAKNRDINLDLNAYTLKTKNGEVFYHVGVIRDITKRKAAENALQESETKYRILAEKMHDVVWILNLDMQSTYVSPSTEFTLGYTPEERMSMQIDECLVPESLDYAMHRLINEAVTTQEGRASKDRGILLELEYYHKDGSTRWLEQSINGIYNDQGELTEIMGVARDITERKKVKDALQQSEASYRGLFNSVTDAIYILDEDGKFVDVNDGAVKMYGHPHDILVGKDPTFVSAPGKNDLADIAEKIKLAHNGVPQQFEFWGKRFDETCFLKDVRLYSGVYFGQRVVIALAQDITMRKQAEEALYNKVNELERLNKRVIGEERQLSLLRQEVNQLLIQIGEKEKYAIC